jgi:hypothetical protein
MYSHTPKDKPVFKQSIYAGATIIDTPKSAAAVIATENANKIKQKKYANSLWITIFLRAAEF